MKISPKKLMHSKWTAVIPQDREKHFLVVRVEVDELDTQKVLEVDLQAVLTRRSYTMPWRELNDSSRWQPGWL